MARTIAWKMLLDIHRCSLRFDEVIQAWGGSLLSLALRCYVGWQFFASGLVKIQDWPATLSLFHDEYAVPLLPPDLAAWLGAGGELVLPVFLFLGWFSRPAALALFGVNAMAVISYPQLWQFECPAAIYQHFYWGSMLLVVLCFGAGRFSLDAFFTRGK